MASILMYVFEKEDSSFFIRRNSLSFLSQVWIFVQNGVTLDIVAFCRRGEMGEERVRERSQDRKSQEQTRQDLIAATQLPSYQAIGNFVLTKLRVS